MRRCRPNYSRLGRKQFTMSFRLFKCDPVDLPVREISFKDLDNKAFWCKLGEEKEEAFVKYCKRTASKYKIQIHPEKETNPYHPDLLVKVNGIEQIGEVKIKNSPFFFAEKHGVNPQFALTMDLKDSFNYTRLLNEGTDLLIFIWVKWEAHVMICGDDVYRVKPMQGIWVTNFSKLRALQTGSNPPEIHWYKADFRQSRSYKYGEEPEFATKLADFDPRLSRPDGTVKGISSNGYIRSGQIYYPSGQSSGSYVFNLKDNSVFTPAIYGGR